VLLNAVQFHRREERPVRQVREPFRLAAHPDEALDVVVPWGEVRVADGPIDGDAVAQIGFEIQIAPAIDLASPDDGLAADLPGAKPVERPIRRRGVRIVGVVGPKNVTPLVE
jgi:hypothetical protein